jgi:hypothetical protein
MITETEDIPLQQAFQLTPPKHSISHNCASLWVRLGS